MYQFEQGSDIHHASITSLNVLRGLDALLLNMEKDLAESGQITNLHRCIWELTQEVPHRRTLIIAHDHALEAQEKIASIRASIKTISALTDRLNQQGDIPVPGDEGSWHFGKLMIVGSVEPFLRGHLERREVIPLVSDLPRSVALFLVSVPTTRDYVEREIHNGQWGYHYHYLDAKKRRSDTLLTFDAASPPNTQPKLCWEPHAETHTISARPEAWGSKKRESVYSVCFPDTTKWPLSVFKRPATNASPVWPVNPPSVTPPHHDHACTKGASIAPSKELTESPWVGVNSCRYTQWGGCSQARIIFAPVHPLQGTVTTIPRERRWEQKSDDRR